MVKKALSLMQGHDDWRQLPGLLEGLHKSNSRPDLDFQEKIVRKAIQADQLGVVVICLNRSDLTGLTLKNEGILNLVIWGLHEYAQSAAWEEARVRKAIRYADEIAQMLEAEEHGTGRKIAQNDPRTRPSTIGVYLELAAVAAQKYQGGKDVDGSVRRYAERLMACINDSNQVCHGMRRCKVSQSSSAVSLAVTASELTDSFYSLLNKTSPFKAVRPSFSPSYPSGTVSSSPTPSSVPSFHSLPRHRKSSKTTNPDYPTLHSRFSLRLPTSPAVTPLRPSMLGMPSFDLSLL